MTPLSPTHAVSPLPAQTEGGRVKRREKEVIQWIYSDKKEKLYYIKGGHQLTIHNEQAVKPFDLSSSSKTVLVSLKKNTFTAATYTWLWGCSFCYIGHVSSSVLIQASFLSQASIHGDPIFNKSFALSRFFFKFYVSARRSPFN